VEIGHSRKIWKGALHHAKQIATNWEEKVKAIKQSFVKAG